MNRSEFLQTYYNSPHVRHMIRSQFDDVDYCIGSGQDLISQGWNPSFPVHVIPWRDNPHTPFFSHRIRTPDHLMDLGLELFRPIRDKSDRILVITWDLEYFNRPDPLWLYRENGDNQRKIFQWMGPVYDTLTRMLNELGIQYCVDVTASGIHVWSAVSTDSEAFALMASEGMLEESLEDKYLDVRSDDLKRYKPVWPELGMAYHTAGKLLEYLTHALIRHANHSPLPITISDSPQGGTSFPDSGLSSDLTQYAHPIFMRVMRLIGSTHQKVNKLYPHATPAVDIVKLPGMSWDDCLDIMWNAEASAAFYEGFEARIPVSNAGWLRVLKAYRKSPLRKWHREFETGGVESYRYRMLDHPPCVQTNIHRHVSKDALLTPGNLQLIAEYMDGSGENLARIAEGIGHCYSDPSYGWFDPVLHTGIDWNKYDPYQAANFWMRCYMGLFRAGLGRGLDCQTLQESGLCAVPYCGINLEPLMKKRMAARPRRRRI